MSNPNLVNYISLELAKGKDKQEIKNVLLGVGWSDQDLEDGFSTVASVDPNSFVDSSHKKIPSIAILTLVLVVVMVGSGIFGYSVLKKATRDKIQQDFGSEQNTIKESLEDSGAISDLVQNIPSVDKWQEYKFDQAGFIVRFVSEPKIKSEDKTTKTKSTLYEATASVPGEDIRYSVNYFVASDQNTENLSVKEKETVGIFAIKFTFKLMYGDAVIFTESEPFLGHTALNYIISSPKKYLGKIVSTEDGTYVIGAECMRCGKVPEFENFVNSFRFLDGPVLNNTTSTNINSSATFISGSIKVKVPNTLNYTYNTLIPPQMKEYLSEAMTVYYSPSSESIKNPVVIITKSPNKEKFNQALQVSNLNTYSPSEESFNISGTQAAVFNGKVNTQNTGEIFLAVPGKSAFVYIKSTNSIGISQYILDQLVKSIEL